MIRGSEVHVAAASEENGFVELPPEAAKHPWAQIGNKLTPPIPEEEVSFSSYPLLLLFKAAGRTVTESPLKRPEIQRSRHKEVVSYEADF